MRLNVALILTLATLLVAATGCRRQRLAQNGGAQNSAPTTERVTSNNNPTRERSNSSAAKNVVTIKRSEGGTFIIPAKVNGVEMDFVFDTGAALVSLSAVEASFLYRQGKLSNSDIVGQGQFVDANGSITTNTVINLRDVTIGDKTIHNVQASVSENQQAPLLLGQTVLNRFGKVTIDNQHNQIIFQ